MTSLFVFSLVLSLGLNSSAEGSLPPPPPPPKTPLPDVDEEDKNAEKKDSQASESSPASGDKGDAAPESEQGASETARDADGRPVVDENVDWATAETERPEDKVEWVETESSIPPPPDRKPEHEPPLNLAQTRPVDNRSSQQFAFELKFGPYLPSVDKRFKGDGFGPYASVFGRQSDGKDGNRPGETTGEPATGLMAILGFEWQFYNPGDFGPLLLGTSIGIFRDTANALIPESELPDEVSSNRSDADETRFNLVPITLQVGYRFEWLADTFNYIPLVPYAKIGLGLGVWWSTKGGVLSRNSSGEIGRGASLGWQANLGGMLRLDFITRGDAAELDRSHSINHTYLFFEFQHSQLDGFGSSKATPVGDSTWFAGFAAEF